MKIKIKRLHHIQICIPTGQEVVAREFYTNIIGLKEIEKPFALKQNGGLWYQAGDIELHIGTEPYTENSKRHPAFEVEHLEEMKHYLQKHSVTIKEETQIPGMKRFSFFDPFNNRFELLQRSSS
ncbi:VOC family protein [Pseudalkalibacillus decolorationis]|uniref:VOC family protein n=1 Tax=Pseudalkalibacillus decolorationis TaxID=163879 RepID=UPI0021495968|nr:VOC family protein [Pseudalkalibacillus decolorationis]